MRRTIFLIPCHALVGVAGHRADETVRVAFEGLLAQAGRVAESDQAPFDSPAVHLRHGYGDRVVDVKHLLFGNLLEHVLDREGELLGRLPILGLTGDEGVGRLHIVVREADERVDDPDARG